MDQNPLRKGFTIPESEVNFASDNWQVRADFFYGGLEMRYSANWLTQDRILNYGSRFTNKNPINGKCCPRNALGVIVFSFFLGGCDPVTMSYGLSTISYTIGGAQVIDTASKAVQLTSDTTVEFRFSNLPITPETAQLLSSIKSFAVWPSEQARIIMASKLEEAGYEVATPLKVKTTLNELGISGNPENGFGLQEMTRKEILEVFNKVATKNNVEAVIANIRLSAETKGRVVTVRSNFLIYLKEKSAIIWEEEMEHIIISGGATEFNKDEFQRQAGLSMAERILEVTGKAPKKEVPATSSAGH